MKAGDDGRDQAKVKKVSADGSMIKKETDSGGLARKDGKTGGVKSKDHSMKSDVKVKREPEYAADNEKEIHAKVKKEKSSVKIEQGSAKKNKISSTTIEKKQAGKVVTKKSKSTVVKVEEKEKQRKVYELPGQRHDPPAERDPLRIFYQSLYEQIPSSEMAEVWMMEHGLLAKDMAKKAYERKQKRQQQQKLGTPTKPSPSAKQASHKREKDSTSHGKIEAESTKVSKARKEGNSDDEFVPRPKKKLKLGK